MITKTEIENSKVGLIGGKIDWDALPNIICVHLAQYGLHGQVIAKQTGLTRAQVYYRLWKVGLPLRRYRDGNTQPARIIIKNYGIRTIKPTTVKQLKSQTVTLINW